MKKNHTKGNYDLKSKAVETLAGSSKGTAPAYSKEELERYRSKSKIRIPQWLKIVFIKAWFAGAVCFFFLWGLGTYLPNMLDMLFVLAVAMGLVTDVLVNNVIRFIESTPGENNRWMLFPKKGMGSFFLNLLYSFLIIFCVYMIYNIVNYIIISITGATDTVPLGVESVLFGILCMAVDMLFVGMKRLIKSMISDAKYAANPRTGEAENEAP